MKKIIITIDDGTIYDKDLIRILNKYNLKASFNLNSGLDDYVWYYNDIIPIKRLKLSDNVDLYKNFEICCHSLTHPRLNLCSDEKLRKEILEDKINLEKIFNRKIDGFVIPFDTFNEHVINTIKEYDFKFIRLPIITSDTLHYEDEFHISCNGYTFDNDFLDSFTHFINNGLDDDIYVFAGHSYDFYVNNSFDLFEQMCKLIIQNNIKSTTFIECLKMYGN